MADAPLEKAEEALSRILTKLSLSMPLTPAEAKLADFVERNQVLRYEEKHGFDNDGNFVISKTMNAEPVMEGVKYHVDRRAALGGKDGKAGQRLIGSIDPVTAANFIKDCGYGIGTAGFNEYAIRKLETTHTKFSAKDK